MYHWYTSLQCPLHGNRINFQAHSMLTPVLSGVLRVMWPMVPLCPRIALSRQRDRWHYYHGLVGSSVHSLLLGTSDGCLSQQSVRSQKHTTVCFLSHKSQVFVLLFNYFFRKSHSYYRQHSYQDCFPTRYKEHFICKHFLLGQCRCMTSLVKTTKKRK